MSQTRNSTKKRLFRRSKPKVELKNNSHIQKIEAKKSTGSIKEESKKQENTKKREFPNISRFIPELNLLRLNLPKLGKSKKYNFGIKRMVLLLLIILGVAANILVGRTFLSSYTSWTKVVGKRHILYTKMQTWENITKIYPNYRDAYFAEAILAYQLKERNKEQEFLDSLSLVDPNFLLSTALIKIENVQGLE